MWLWWFIANTMHFNARLFTVPPRYRVRRLLPTILALHLVVPSSLEMRSAIVEELDSGDVKPNGLNTTAAFQVFG